MSNTKNINAKNTSLTYDAEMLINDYVLDDRVSIPGTSRIFSFFATSSGPAVGRTQSPIPWVQGTLSAEINWPEREGNYTSRV